jgi:hypothetical protein|tara:strand:- start:168 stop:542 length:375 start_codon:yes stop_codon:yes gene_type:complete
MRLFVIQEHNADKAGLHWDIRFEDYDKHNLRSFVIPKHRLPNNKERLLVVPVSDHKWEYKDFEGEIKEGYGKGTVKLVHNDYVKVPSYTDKEIIFEFEGETYRIYKASWMQNYLIQRHENTKSN